jgi:aspartate beta-hydroxylase
MNSPFGSSPDAAIAAAVAAAMSALTKGDVATAKAQFESIVAAGRATAIAFIGLAHACKRLGDAPGALRAVERALALEPRNILAIVLRADMFADSGDNRAAAAYYNAAVKLAGEVTGLPNDVARAVEHARTMCARYANALEESVRQSLHTANNLGAESPRFQQALDIMFGHRERYIQDPRYFFFPELPQRQFFSRDEFPWIAALEAQTQAIRFELLSVLKSPADFKPYVQGRADRPQKAQAGMLNNPDWSAFYLYKDGVLQEQNAARCPKTMAAIASIPLTVVQHRSPSVLFSLLRPGAHIPAHTGMINTRLIGHLPLIVPPACTFRVGNELRTWEEGKAWLFDDTIEHEAWNRSSETRVILIFEVWRPELSVEEQRGLQTMFAAIDAHTGVKPQWEI